MIRYETVLFALMLSVLLGVSVSMEKKPIQAIAADFIGNWPTRSREPIAEAQTSVMPRGSGWVRVPIEPASRHLKGLGTQECAAAINLGINRVALFQHKNSVLDCRESKASARV